MYWNRKKSKYVCEIKRVQKAIKFPQFLIDQQVINDSCLNMPVAYPGGGGRTPPPPKSEKLLQKSGVIFQRSILWERSQTSKKYLVKNCERSQSSIEILIKNLKIFLKFFKILFIFGPNAQDFAGTNSNTQEYLLFYLEVSKSIITGVQCGALTHLQNGLANF